MPAARRLIFASVGAAFIAGPCFGYELASTGVGGAADRQSSTLATHDNVATDTRDYDRGGIFDEVRLGGSAFLGGHADFQEDGAFVTAQVLFDPLLDHFDNALADVFLRPRPHLGAVISTEAGTDQIFAGLTWDVPIGRTFFAEASFGGTAHDGALHRDPGQAGIELGCRVLFRESIGAGVNFGHWDLVAAVDHSSNAGLCADNDGLTHAGLTLGYRFF